MPSVNVNTATATASAAIAVNAVSRDGQTEAIQLTNISDPATAVCAPVTTNGLGTFSPLTTGVVGYYSGISGLVTIPAGARVVSIAAASISGGSLTINGSTVINIQSNSSISLGPQGNLVSPSLQFNNTSSYIIETVT